MNLILKTIILFCQFMIENLVIFSQIHKTKTLVKILHTYSLFKFPKKSVVYSKNGNQFSIFHIFQLFQ